MGRGPFIAVHMAKKAEKAKADILSTLDESVQGLRQELSARIDAALASPTGQPSVATVQQQLQPGILLS